MSQIEENDQQVQEVYQNVFESCKKIIEKNQRDLYINTLDLITRTTNAISPKFLTNEIIKFLYTDILQLLFDDDINIQENAIITMDMVLSTIDTNSFHNSIEWIPIRANIIENYSAKLHLLRNSNNCNWYKIWNILIQILNQEIIKSASIINIYLSIVELGFRSANHRIRGESFISWKTLVQIFAKHDFTSLKRIKLISIPLRSSQAKTEFTALHKFKAWWYFLLKLQENNRLLETSEKCFEPFLIFCFGSTNVQSQFQAYFSIKEMAVISLIEMLNYTTVEIRQLMEKFELEKSSTNIITGELFKKHYTLIIRSVYQASLIVLEEFLIVKKQIFELLWKNLIEHIIRNDLIESYKECFDYILLLIKLNNPEINESVHHIINVFVTNTNFLSMNKNENQGLAIEKLSTKIIYFSNILLSSPDKYFSNNESKSNTFLLTKNELFLKSLRCWDVMKIIIEHFLTHSGYNDQNDIEINIDNKFLFWEAISKCLISYLNENSFEFRIVSKANLLNKWIMLPIEKYPTHLNNGLIKCWKELAISASKSEGRSNFLAAISTEILKLNFEQDRIIYIDEIINTIIECVDTRFDQSTYPKEIFTFLTTLFTNKCLSCKTNNKILQKFTWYINQLEAREINLTINDLIAITKFLGKSEKIKSIAKNYFELFKKTLLDQIKKYCNSSLVKEYKDALKSETEFVVIPKIWTMNPDRLTEHQKEKMKEKKNNLPALYNDMSSHSQDSNSLKPWTPSKIVIAKNKDNEKIVLPGINKVIQVQSPKPEKKGKIETLNKKESQNNINQMMDSNSNNTNLVDESENKVTNNIESEKESSESTDENHVLSNSNTEDSEMGKQDSRNVISKKRRATFTKDDEKLLKKMNIQVDNEKTKIQIIKNLKNIHIDTVDGNVKINKNLDGVTTRRSNTINTRRNSTLVFNKNEKGSKSINENELTSSRYPLRRNSVKQLNNNSQSADLPANKDKTKKKKQKSTNSDEEIIESSQQSESIISRRSTRKSLSKKTTHSDLVEQNNKVEDCLIQQVLKQNDTSEKINEINLETVVNKQSDGTIEITISPNSNSSIIAVTDPNPEKIIEISSNLFETVTEIMSEKLNESDVVSPNEKYTLSNKNMQSIEEQNNQINDNTNTVSTSFGKTIEPTEFDTSTHIKHKSPKKNLQSDQLSKISPSDNSDTINKTRRSPRKQLKFDNKSEDNANTLTPIKPLNNFEEVQISPVFSPIKSQIIIEEKLSNNILSSPGDQTLEQTREFLCNTSNISPIVEILPESVPPIQNGKIIQGITFEEDILNDCSDTEKQLSPNSKNMTKQILLSSPPDRRNIVITTSPTPKPKTSTLTGRGAQFINMIRNRNSGGQTSKDGELSVKRVLETSITTNRSSPKICDIRPGLQTPQISSQIPVSRELLTFSKILPSPYASPSVSILKRKANRLSLDESDVQASKRKRVGFSDPVSITKEYVLQPEEDKLSSSHSVRLALNKALNISGKCSSSTEQIQKHMLKRKSRADSILEIAKFREDILSPSPIQSKKRILTNISHSSTPNGPESKSISPSLDRISPVKLKDVDELESVERMNENKNNNADEILVTSLPPMNPLFNFSKDEEVLDYVLNKYTLDDLLVKYMEKTTKQNSIEMLTMKSVKILMKEIMNSMAIDQKIRIHVFETLSEKHSTEYLDHAIQENLCAVVCDRLDLNSVLNYIFEKSKINNNCYKLVLENIYQMFKTGKCLNDKYELLQNLLTNKLQLTPEQILNCIELLIQHKTSSTELNQLSSG